MIELFNEDCMALMARTPDKAFDLAIVDPPYGLGENKGQHKSRNANRIDRRNGKPIVMNHPGYAVKDWDDKIPDKAYFNHEGRQFISDFIFHQFRIGKKIAVFVAEMKLAVRINTANIGQVFRGCVGICFFRAICENVAIVLKFVHDITSAFMAHPATAARLRAALAQKVDGYQPVEWSHNNMKHETRNTTAVSAWCNHCGRSTLHRVDDRRRGPCLEHEITGMSRDQERRAKKRAREERNLRLF